MMEHLFAYGTLLDPDVQLAVIGRRLNGEPDSLTKYRLSSLLDGSAYPNIVGDPSGRVEGRVLEITIEELDRMDDYEGDLYIRERIALDSGRYAWVYIGTSRPNDESKPLTL
jgi:gamma-glutamylcyclotransferase (GGCT)/AIG2-like uncharacterized protein YtfP